MTILIMTTYFPPDTAIAAVRPYMFAKYLKELGHEVIVIRSGRFSKQPDDSMPYDYLGITVYSYFGEDSPAEKYSRGEWKKEDINSSRRLGFLPDNIRKPMARLYKSVISPFRVLNLVRAAKKNFKLQKKLIDKISGRDIDVVFATYSGLENVYAGAYATKVFNCKWLLDFRDAMAQRKINGPFNYLILRKIQKKAIDSADACTAVSNALAKDLATQTKDKNIITLYNGFESPDLTDSSVSPDTTDSQDVILSFCYTGGLYSGSRDSTVLFEVLSSLVKSGDISTDMVRFDYCGNEFDELLNQAKKHNMENILVNHGYLSRTETASLQSRSDIFVVLTWNTKADRGVLTGKLYEGLRAKKPIIALVSGKQPNSEIRYLVEENNWGVCYEEAEAGQTRRLLKDYILEQYQKKQNGEEIAFTGTQESVDQFDYKNITKKLEAILLNLV